MKYEIPVTTLERDVTVGTIQLKKKVRKKQHRSIL